MTPPLAHEPFQIALDRVDRASFRVVEGRDRVLVVAHKDKHHWREDELHLRSLVTDTRGRVLSAGFPKFFNYGEHAPHDARFDEALGRDAVEFPEKLDGTLVVADVDGDGAVALRTRAQLGLGDYGPLVDALIAARYPRLRDVLASDARARGGCSVLFEFVSPLRPVVVRYAQPALFLLALMDKRTLAPRWDAAALESIAQEAGVPLAPVHRMPRELAAVRRELSQWRGREGVVARAVDADGRPLMIKLKADEYLRLHAHNARLGGGSARKVALLLGLEDDRGLFDALAARGLDFEAAEFLRANLLDYFAERRRVLDALAHLSAHVAPWLARGTGKAHKRDYVMDVRAHVDADPARYPEPFWFGAAIKLFDGRPDEARLMALAHVVDAPVPTVRAWLQDPARELDATLALSAPSDE